MEERETNSVQDHIPFASEPYLEDTLHLPSWLIITLASVIIFGVVFSVLDHARKKPMSPQELVAAAFTQPITAPTLDWKPGMGPQPLIYHPAAANQQLVVQQWKPGMGPKPFIYHPAAFQLPAQANPGWNPLYICPVHGATGTGISGQNGLLYCSICNQPLVMNK
nr:hypothetical protein [Desulfobulbaceae bacterium]